MGDFGAPPVIPPEFQLYNSYEEDPKWQRTFTIVWCSALSASVAFSLPYLVKSIRNQRAFAGLFGVGERYAGYAYSTIAPVDDLDDGGSGSEKLGSEKAPKIPPRKWRTDQRQGRGRERSLLQARVEGILTTIFSVLLWSAPGLGVNVGQIILLIGYAVSVVVCIVKDSILEENSNRAGFMAIAQLPVVFLFATKNSMLSFLLGPGHGYEKLNYIHRWSGRAMFVGAVIHGSLWIQNHLRFGLPILGQQKETTGVAALGVLCAIVLTALRPVRRWFYEVFWVIHVLLFVAFFVTICYHTIYAPPWIFPPLAFYAFDMLLRLFKYRIKDATLAAVGEQMTLIRIPHCDTGWEAGQHIRLRVFFSGRIFESHPLSIMSAPPETSCLRSSDGIPSGILLGARVTGDWTRALNQYATAESYSTNLLTSLEPKTKQEGSCEGAITPVPVHVMIDGPYGGSSIDLGEYESVLLVAGGSGATFTLGLLDDIVGRCIRLNRQRGERTRRIEFAWCVKSFGYLKWFAAALGDIAGVVHDRHRHRQQDTDVELDLDLHISVYVTCLCNPDEVPDIPNMDVTLERPSVKELLRELVTPPDPETTPTSSKLQWAGLGGGVAVCASGPESLTREASNAVASLGLTRGVELGGVSVHTEVFSL
ncbi:hypothetical protein E1B28_007934 [Marasmius oreades]|uniref:ferric-chelate reductase (NADPH) n=1 Tax=Marasmius oreades TaxID=181124 RepID=A0A9P7S2Z5_9AGAR|nr:uncharacterized protein E1B28_007934 [Marasmius oreades]KAG7094335.1 hypothetical protein E1B28_007934 [Marasmius oreades]